MQLKYAFKKKNDGKYAVVRKEKKNPLEKGADMIGKIIGDRAEKEKGTFKKAEDKSSFTYDK